MSGAERIPDLQRRAGDAFKAGRLDEALGACREILALQPERADVMGFAGMIALKLGDDGEAVRGASARPARG